MKLLRLALLGILLLAFASCCSHPKTVSVLSPDRSLELRLEQGTPLRVSVRKDGEILLPPSEISMTLEDGTVYAGMGKVGAVRKTDRFVPARNYKRAQVRDHYCERIVSFGAFDLVCRAYDTGVAWRFVSRSDRPFKVVAEQADLAFPSDWTAWVPYVHEDFNSYEPQFKNSFENTYEHIPLSDWNPLRLAFSPLLIDAPAGRKICVLESDLKNYPGMYLARPQGSETLRAVFAPCPAEVVLGDSGINKKTRMHVVKRAGYLADCQPGEAFPWRILEVEDSESGLLNSDLVFLLASPSEGDFSWVVPGKCTWDWWAAYQLPGVTEFEPGINTRSYLYDIDVAKALGLEYILIDAGWSRRENGDLFDVVPELDLPAVVEYGKQQGVGVILWAACYPFEKDMERVLEHYSKMGVRGFKVDYFDRDDQYIVALQYRMAEACARYHMVLDFHGTFKPAGINRTWPNVLNNEGVFGLETSKWVVEPKMVENDLTIPFTRMVAGPMDYTQGATRNVTRAEYRPDYNLPVSQGTRCHQAAEYVVFHSPLVMLCDAPSCYLHEIDFARFIAGIPVVWDDTLPLENEVGAFVSVARRSGSDWYVGLLGGWEPRDVTLDLSFLGKGEYTMELLCDGPDAQVNAASTVHETRKLGAERNCSLHLAPGGGAVLKIGPSES